MKKEEMTSAAPNEGEVDLTKAQVENVAEPTQGSTNQSGTGKHRSYRR